MRRALLRLTVILGGLVFTLATLVGGVLWWVTARPQDAYRLAERYVLPPDLKISWGHVRFVPRRISWLHWAVEWRVEKLLVHQTTPRLDVPVEEVGVTFEASVWRPRTHADFAKITVRAPERILIEPPDEGDDPPEENPYEMIRHYLDYVGWAGRYFSVDSVDVNLSTVRLILPSGDVTLGLALQKPVPERDPRTFGFSLTGRLGARAVGLKGELEGNRLSVLTTFDGDGARVNGEVRASLVEEKISAQFSGDVTYALGKDLIRAKPEITVALDERHAVLNVTTALAGLPGPVPAIDPLRAQVDVPFASGAMWSSEPSAVTLTAPIATAFVPKDVRAALGSACACQIPERLRADVRGSAWFDALVNQSKVRRPIFDLRLDVEAIENKLFALRAAGGLKGFREREVYTFEPRLDSEAHLRSFRALRNILDARNVMVLAPFDVLEGTVDVTARGPIERYAEGSRTPVEVKVALASEHQRVDLTSTVNLALASTLKSLDVYVKLLIENFTVQLPPLEPLAGVPPISVDQRVQVRPPSAKPVPPPKSAGDGFKVRVFFSARTGAPGAIRLLSALARPHVPITVNVDRAFNGDLTGSVQLEPFGITYLRRTVHVEQLRVMMDERDPANFPVDGRFRLDQTQYKIFVDVSGTVRSPSVRLSSEPYLSRQEIISVLLYDRTSEQLVGGDAETAGSFDAAMADRAIGLFGLWAFASTPIKSFSYNAATKVYSATVQLADGLTAGVGTNWEEAASFEVRKRVSRRWVLTASWSPSEASGDQVGQLVLQWEKRF